jgi:hypothetical protein
LEQTVDGEIKLDEEPPVEDLGNGSESIQQLTSQINELDVSANANVITPLTDSTEGSNSESPVQDIDKRIRALKKKVEFMLLAFHSFRNDHILFHVLFIVYCMNCIE